jgi:hypothetical protein
MKKYFSFLLLIFVCFHAAAQVTTSVKGGVSLANLQFKGDDRNKMRVVGYGGISVNIELPNKLFLQPELLYSIRGYRFLATAQTDKGHVTFGYITAPVLIGYKVLKNFSILVGPEFGYLVRARSRFSDVNLDISSGISRKFNVDADAGIAWNISKSIAFEARVNIGVTALYRGILVDPQGNPSGDFKDGYHRVLQMGISIPL